MIHFRTLDVDGLWNKIEARKFERKEQIRRFQEEKIVERFNTKHVEVVTGPRQSGKTTLLLMLISELLRRGVKKELIFYVNLDTVTDLEQFEGPSVFLRGIKDLVNGNERTYLFLDEVQRLESPGRFLKGLYDLDLDMKIFVSGSSSLEIRSKVKEFLTGRKRETFLLPLSFKEYVNDAGCKDRPQGWQNLETINEDSLEDWRENERIYGKYLAGKMEEMAIYGGYPGVLSQSGRDERIEELAEIYNSYVKKNVVDFFKVEKPAVFNQLVKALSGQVGNLVNKSEVCSLIGSNLVTISRYLEILKETYITHYLPPFLSSRRSEIKSTTKCYFIDNGIRNFSLRQFNALANSSDRGPLIENLVFTELLKGLSLTEELFFWRTKAGAEVDFVLRCEGNPFPVEIKAGSAIPGRLSRSFHAFINHFSPTNALFLNKDLFHIQNINSTRVYYIPLHWFLITGIGSIM